MTTRQQVFCKIYLKKIFNVYVIGVTKFTHNETWFIDKSNGNIVKALRFYCFSDKYIILYDMPESDRYVVVNISNS